MALDFLQIFILNKTISTDAWSEILRPVAGTDVQTTIRQYHRFILLTNTPTRKSSYPSKKPLSNNKAFFYLLDNVKIHLKYLQMKTSTVCNHTKHKRGKNKKENQSIQLLPLVPLNTNK